MRQSGVWQGTVTVLEYSSLYSHFITTLRKNSYMIVRKLRLQKGWSQEQLAEMADLSVRTVQRAERGQSIGMESLKSLAAVFEVDLSQLHQPFTEEDDTMNEENMTWEEQRALEYVRDIKGFYSHLGSFACVIPFLFAINYFITPGYMWAWWPLLGWGIGLASHALSVFEVFPFFGPDWEKKQVEKKLGRKL